jgi:uncharacterized CHY-type Zn-finger protein
MSVGNWRHHLLIACSACNKLMGYHKKSDSAICVNCEMEKNNERKRHC